MIIGVASEIQREERRVALVPAACQRLHRSGIEVHVQAGAGWLSGFADAQYAAAHARVVPTAEEVLGAADVVLKVQAPARHLELGLHEVEMLKEGAALIGLLDPLENLEIWDALARRRITAFSLDLMPRISRAQSMDALSSMATVAGYKAVLIAANLLPSMFPMLITAAGTVMPARVLVMGAGVAGLQAIATARRLGAVVSAYDVRPSAKEQVQSLGARFVELEIPAAEAEDKSGYARALGEDFYRRQRELMTHVVTESDVVITTAAVPGQRAPVLITAEMVRGMRAGAVVVDLAAERGGNCELTEPGQQVIENGVTIVGPLNVAATVPRHASELYAGNLTNFVQLVVRGGRLVVDTADDIIRATLVTHAGEVVHAGVRRALGADVAMAGNP